MRTAGEEEGLLARLMGWRKCFMCERVARRGAMHERVPNGLDRPVPVCPECDRKLDLADAYLRAMKGG